jgi:RNA polymerase sigma factor (sigma-70 family)
MAETPPFAALYVQHRPAALRVALALVPPDVADDIVAEAFARVMAAVRRGGGPKGEFRPYLLAAVRNVARDHLAARRREVPVPAPEPRTAEPGADLAVVRREEAAMAWRAFESLPARWRAVLWQTAVEGRAPAELARHMGMTPNAVARLAVRAREGLALAWERERGLQERVTGPLPALRILAARRTARKFS